MTRPIDETLIGKDREIARLQEAKRKALAIADARSVENVGLKAENERLRERLSTCEIYLAEWDVPRIASYWSIYDVPKPAKEG